MTVPSDPFTFVNGVTADAVQVNGRFAPLYAALNAALDVDNLLAAVKDKVGISDASVVRRGVSSVPTAQNRLSTAYGTMPTPDQVSNVVLPTNGLMFVAFTAQWQETVNGAARAAIFLGSNQLKTAAWQSSVPAVQEAGCLGGAGIRKPLASGPQGLVGFESSNPTTYTGDVTTGQVIGVLDDSASVGPPSFGFGACMIKAAAGTYTVSVQFKASSGEVTAQDRTLWVWTTGF